MMRESPVADDGAGADGVAAPADQAAPDGNTSGALATIGAITSQLALITALLYYFGWVRTNSFLNYFGIDSGLAGYSTADYILRSIGVAFPPFIRTAVIALTLLGMHQLIVAPMLEESERGLTSPATPDAHPVTSPHAILRRAWTLARWRPGPQTLRWCLTTVQATGVALVAVVLTGILLPERT